ncbi:sensor domain-containing phosphodiesterase [Aliidiomarina sp. Khilg15.8]
MQSPQIPNNELERLDALLQTNLLDSLPESRFDRITRLAQSFFDVPIALVSLLDAERQWFKSKQGLSVTETHRDFSFCGHAILDSQISEVPDASKDPRFADNPLVTGAPFIRFYAGVPLYTDEGYAIGTLCIIDTKPRQLNAVDHAVLRDLADIAALEINQAERQKQYQNFRLLKHLSEIIVRAQSNFIRQANRTAAFNILLDDILAVTSSEYGFIGDVLYTTDGQPYLKAYAMTDISWSAENKALYAANVGEGLEFRNLDTLFGAVITTGEPVITNERHNDPRNGGLPQGHPELHSFLGIPIFSGDTLVAMVGLANKEGGYDQELLALLKPLLVAIGHIVEATERHRIEAELKQELNRLSKVANQTTNAVVITSLDGKTEWVNEGFTRLTGYRLQDIRGHKPGSLLQGPDTDPATVTRMRTALEKAEDFEADIINYTRDGHPYWNRIHCNPLIGENGALQGFIAIQSNIDSQKRTEIALEESVQLQNTILDTMADGLVTTDQDGVIRMCNPSLESIFGYSKEWLLGKNVKELMPEGYVNVHDSYMQKYKNSNLIHDIMGKARALTAKRHDGSIFPVEIAVKQTQHNGEALYVASIRDISALKEQQEEIEKLAYFDALTQLPNRRLLEARTKALVVLSKHSNHCNALLFIDLDNFKNINDILGHSVGDRLLVEIGQRIQSSVLSCSDTVARLGGDEFCVLLPTLGESLDKAKARASVIAKRIIDEIEKPLLIENDRLAISASIGVSFFCGEQVELTALMKQADIAMYEAKAQGKSRVCFFNSDLEARLLKRLTMESELRNAIAEGTLTVHYQPIVDESSRVVKVEALARWNHPTEGWITPETFIPIAESYQLIIPLGEFVLKTAIRDMEAWLTSEPELNWQVAINISQFQLSYDDFPSQIQAALADSRLDPSRIILEVTESALAQDIDESIARMAAIKSLGLGFSLDDFGTGYSSLAYLKRLPISELKIDRSFINDLPDELDDIAIVNSVLSLAKAMELEVVAEGVENEQQWQFLKNLKCERFQGYYFSRPQPASEIEKLIENGRHLKLRP